MGRHYAAFVFISFFSFYFLTRRIFFRCSRYNGQNESPLPLVVFLSVLLFCFVIISLGLTVIVTFWNSFTGKVTNSTSSQNNYVSGTVTRICTLNTISFKCVEKLFFFSILFFCKCQAICYIYSFP